MLEPPVGRNVLILLADRLAADVDLDLAGFPGQPLQRRRSAVPFVLGAIAFALVGFGIVAAVLQYLKTGAF